MVVGFSQIELTSMQKDYRFGGSFESIDHKKGNTGKSWYVLNYRDLETVLLPVSESTKTIALSIGLVLFILVIVALLIGRQVAHPLIRLIELTGKIAKGDFRVRAEIKTKDEFGILAQSFNRMGAIVKVRTLSGILPICSYCKKIKTDEGYWKQIEAYIQEHSEAEFSHGICRECAEKYYPEMNLYEEK